MFRAVILGCFGVSGFSTHRPYPLSNKIVMCALFVEPTILYLVRHFSV